jgi:hypothetical protein
MIKQIKISALATASKNSHQYINSNSSSSTHIQPEIASSQIDRELILHATFSFLPNEDGETPFIKKARDLIRQNKNKRDHDLSLSVSRKEQSVVEKQSHGTSSFCTFDQIDGLHHPTSHLYNLQSRLFCLSRLLLLMLHHRAPRW